MARSDLSIRIGADLSGLNSQLGGALKGLKRFGFKAESIGRDLTTRISLPLIALGGVAVKTFAEFDRLEKGLAALSGSAQGGADAFSRLNKIVLDTRTTLDLKTAALGEQRLVGAGLAAAEAERTIKQLGIAATVSGSSIDDVGGVLRQFTQIVGKGKVEQEDLNSILDRMPALGALITAEFGGSTAEAIRDTGISMEDFVSRLTTSIEVNKDFQSVQGGLAKSFESFANAVQVGIRPLGESIAKSLNLEKNLQRLGDFVGRASQAFADLNPNVQKFIIFTGLAVAAVGPLTFGLGAIAKSIPLLISGFSLLGGPLTAVTGGLKVFSGLAGILIPGGGIARVVSFSAALGKLSSVFAVLTGPVALIAAGIALVAISFNKAQKNSGFFRLQLDRVVQALAPIAEALTEFVKNIIPDFSFSLSGLGKVFNFVFSVIAGGISFLIEGFIAIIETVKNVAGAVSDIFSGDFSGAAKKLGDTLFNPAVLAATAKDSALAAAAVFTQTLAGENTRDAFGSAGSGPRETGGTGGGGADIAIGGGGDFREAIRQVQTIDTLPLESVDFAFKAASASAAALSDKIKALKPNLEAGIFDGYRDGLSVITERQLAFGDTYDALAAKIGLTKGLIDDLTQKGYPANIGAVALLQEQLTGLTETQLEQAESQRIANTELGITKSLYESLGIAFEGAFSKFTEGQKAVSAAAALTANLVTSTFDGLASGVKNFAQALASATRSIIGNFIKQGVAAVVSGSLTSSAFLGPLAIPIGAAAGAGANALFQTILSSLNVPALADGGITTGAQLALIGEAGPEAVVPLPTLDALIRKAGGGGNSGSFGGNVEFVIRGEDLVGVISRAESSYKRSF
jgi:tape measure domain-containing protein